MISLEERWAALSPKEREAVVHDELGIETRRLSRLAAVLVILVLSLGLWAAIWGCVWGLVILAQAVFG